MKKTLCLMFFLVITCSSVFAGVDRHFVGLSLIPGLNNAHDFTSSAGGAEYDMSTGFSVLYEGLVEVTDWFSLGGGVELEFPREVDISGGDPTVFMAPAYVTCIFDVYEINGIRPFASVRLGWLFGFSGNDDYLNTYETSIFGLHVGIGGGIKYKNWRAELRWSRDTGKLENGPGPDINVTDHRLSLVAGYTF